MRELTTTAMTWSRSNSAITACSTIVSPSMAPARDAAPTACMCTSMTGCGLPCGELQATGGAAWPRAAVGGATATATAMRAAHVLRKLFDRIRAITGRSVVLWIGMSFDGFTSADA